MNRRQLIRLGAGAVATGIPMPGVPAITEADRESELASQEEQWSVYEIQLAGPPNGNPFLDIQFGARYAFNPNDRYLWYFDYHCVAEYEFPLPEIVKFKATMIDPFATTRTPMDGIFSGKSKIKLTGKPYMAVLFEKT